MVSIAVSKLGKTSLIFVQPGVKVNSAVYCDQLLNTGLLPDIRRLSGDNFIFQQDGAPAHRSQQTVAFLRQTVPDFIEPENWPPNSPDLNPVDYSIWGALQQLVYRTKIRDVLHLKEVLVRCWDEIGQNLINRAIDQWYTRICLVINELGGHIEHLLD
jgi:inhibitor of nuclear factor kappa-B kinase subunit alpha